MSRRTFYFSLLALSLSACSSVSNKQAEGDFAYQHKSEAKPLVIPESLAKPSQHQDFFINDKINHQGPIGEKMDIRAPSLVMPVAASSRVVAESDVSIIWFDKVLENEDLFDFIEKTIIEKIKSDGITYQNIQEEKEITLSKVFEGATSLKETSIDRAGIRTKVLESDWYHDEVDVGWLYTDIESSTSLRFRYQLLAKPHGRSVSLRVSLVDFLKTDQQGGSKTIDPIDKQRAEKAMLNSIVSLVDYNYRIQQRENRLTRANQKLVALGKNSAAEDAYVVEMDVDKLWDNMPVFFEKYGFTISDINDAKKIYYVDFVKPETSLWDSIWGDDAPVVDVNEENYQFVLAPLNENEDRTSVTIYNASGEPLPMATLERIFPVVEEGLSFRNVF
jgi:outer membrane protein assembly factor BamC